MGSTKSKKGGLSSELSNLPTHIFSDKKLAILEAIVEYLKDDKGLSYKSIGELLKRDERNIWTVYNRVKKKRKSSPLRRSPVSEVKIPIEILRDRTLSGFEAIVEWLKEKSELSFHEIGLLLNRDERNIWTVYHRAKKKRK